jgi:hypothetical protein
MSRTAQNTWLAAVGKFKWHRFVDQQGRTTELAECPKCFKQHAVAHYGFGWCDDCMAEQGYLPPQHKAPEERILFKLFVDEAKTHNFTWDEYWSLAQMWRTNRAKYLNGQFTSGEVLSVRGGAAVKNQVCAWHECGNMLTTGSISGFCGGACYQRDYRLKKKEALKVARKKRIELAKKEKAAQEQIRSNVATGASPVLYQGPDPAMIAAMVEGNNQ